MYRGLVIAVVVVLSLLGALPVVLDYRGLLPLPPMPWPRLPWACFFILCFAVGAIVAHKGGLSDLSTDEEPKKPEAPDT